MDNERDTWNRRYSNGSHFSQKPDPFLVKAYDNFIQPLFPQGGTALDLAGGIGRHAIWLAQRGWRVTLLDISEVGLNQARRNATQLAKRIKFRVTDLKSFSGASRYDLVLAFFYLERAILPELLRSVKTGGLLVYKTYTRKPQNLDGGPSHPSHLLDENELLRAFAGMRVLGYRETIRERGIAEFVGRKNAPAISPDRRQAKK
jgi:SAM-dependent methyltransferase